MKKILITGENSYIGNSFNEYSKIQKKGYHIDTLDMKNSSWKKFDFSIYDVVIHLAAIVHVKEKDENLYYQINKELAFETGEKAKSQGVKHFLFFSTMAVYGKSIGEIGNNSSIAPSTPYGKSKYLAEISLKELEDEKFKLAIIRPPMVYGKFGKGNYEKMVAYSKYIPVFPDSGNMRSMISIKNLCSFVCYIIDNERFGTFHPQNEEFVNTADMVKMIRKRLYGKYCLSPKSFFLKKVPLKLFQKIFGDLYYSFKGEVDKKLYIVENFEESIK